MSPRDQPLATRPGEALDRTLWQRPLVTLACALVVGVVLADALRWPPLAWALLMLPFLAVTLAPLHGRLPALALLLSIACLAGLLHALRLTPSPDDPSRLAGATPASVTARVVGPVPGWRPGIALDVVAVQASPERPLPTRGKALLELPFGVEPPPTGALISLAQPAIALPPAPTNWFQRDRRPALHRRGIHCLVSAAAWSPMTSPGRGLDRVAAQWRATASRLLTAAVPAAHRAADAPVLIGMVLGDQAADLDPQAVEPFRRTGTIHLLVVSGAQVSVLMVFLVALLRGRGRLGWWQVLVVALALAWFGMVVGMGASVSRSLVMAGVWMLAILSGRRYDLASGIALAAIVLVLSDTSVVFGIGAQLTFAATLGVALGVGATDSGHGLFAGPAASRTDAELAAAGLSIPQAAGRTFGLALRQAGAGTAGAWLLTTPLLAFHFGGFALLGSVANLIAVPLAGIIVVLGLLIATLGAFAGPVASLLGWVAWASVWVVRSVVEACDRLPLACVDNVHFPLWQCALWLLLAAAFAWAAQSAQVAGRPGRVAATTLTAVVAIAAALITLSALASLRPARLSITALDVGEGQCTVVETPARRVIVFDAGGRFRYNSWQIAREVLIPFLVGRGHRRIDALVLSHTDVDHTGAVAPLARRMPVGQVLLGGGEGGETYRKGLLALEASGAQLRHVAAGSAARVDDAALQFLWPPPGSVGGASSSLSSNNASVVTRMTCAGLTALFPGDLETPGMDALVAAWAPAALRAGYLQVPHHGRDSAASPAFMAAVSPSVAVVSRAGEPDWRGGQALAASASRTLLTTQQWGAVCVQTTPHGLRLRTFLRPQPAAAPPTARGS